MYKKAVTYFVILLCVQFIATATQQQVKTTDYYTNKQASDCVQQKAISTCFQPIKYCTDNKQCAQELTKYQQCTFGVSQSQIFNGNCFRKWQQSSILTKGMIDCLVKQCNLNYNSVIGLQKLFQCTQQAIINNYAECEENCLKQLNKIRGKFTSMKIDELFDIQIEDQAAQGIVNIIKSKCIHNQLSNHQNQGSSSKQQIVGNKAQQSQQIQGQPSEEL